MDFKKFVGHKFRDRVIQNKHAQVRHGRSLRTLNTVVNSAHLQKEKEWVIHTHKGCINMGL